MFLLLSFLLLDSVLQISNFPYFCWSESGHSYSCVRFPRGISHPDQLLHILLLLAIDWPVLIFNYFNTLLSKLTKVPQHTSVPTALFVGKHLSACLLMWPVLYLTERLCLSCEAQVSVSASAYMDVWIVMSIALHIYSSAAKLSAAEPESCYLCWSKRQA